MLQALNIIRDLVSFRKQIKLVIFHLAHSMSPKIMKKLYGYGESTIRKYTRIICFVLSNRNGLFRTYIHAPIAGRLQEIIEKFRDLTSFPNVACSIDGIHIPMARWPSRRIIPMQRDFSNKKNFHNMLLQDVCDLDLLFWNVCVGQFYKVHDGGQFSWSILYGELYTRKILKEPVIQLHNEKVRPYLLDDFVYPSMPYMLENFKTNICEL